MGVICAQFFKKMFTHGKGCGFWGFNNESPQGMLCLVIGLFKVHSKKIMEVVNTAEETLEEDAPTSVNLIQEAMQLHNLLALIHLLARLTEGREVLMDYFRSHVMTSIEYLGVLQQKTIDKQ